jgi:hypothetical protein
MTKYGVKNGNQQRKDPVDVSLILYSLTVGSG